MGNMAKNKTYKVDRYPYSEKDKLFFDANIWLFLYGPQDLKDWRIPVYSKALHHILSAKGKVFIDVLVFSEIINRYARIEFELNKTLGGSTNFKTFRNSSKFNKVAKDIVDACRRILKNCERTQSDFKGVDIDSLLNDFQAGQHDFNDPMLAEICKLQGLKLVTHDGDFKDRGLTVLTANKRLLS